MHFRPFTAPATMLEQRGELGPPLNKDMGYGRNTHPNSLHSGQFEQMASCAEMTWMILSLKSSKMMFSLSNPMVDGISKGEYHKTACMLLFKHTGLASMQSSLGFSSKMASLW